MSRTFRRVNKYVPYCTLSNVKELASRKKIALMDPDRYRFLLKYLNYDEEYAAKFYRDGYKDGYLSSMSFRKNSIYKTREKAYYKHALAKCLKSEDLEYIAVDKRKILGGCADWW